MILNVSCSHNNIKPISKLWLNYITIGVLQLEFSALMHTDTKFVISRTWALQASLNMNRHLHAKYTHVMMEKWKMSHN